MNLYDRENRIMENTGIPFEDGDDALFDETSYADALAWERRILSKPVPMPEQEPQTEPERARRRLQREVKAEALERVETSARTHREFENVINIWNRLDKNRERRERSHELLRGDVPVDYGLRDNYDALVFPEWMGTPMERQLSAGYFLDWLADCPYDMHDLTEKNYIRKAVAEMKDEHKELLYFLGVKHLSPQQVACLRNQSDRNIRKVRDVMFRKLRKRLYEALQNQMRQGYKPALREARFIRRYETGMEEPNAQAV
ncbi:MAG: sigma-70 family RNA polymerase sigma factor [Oscillospiraceae bacterium]|nr:sigma-70 family RNA polymerase sigma factor [Oscillospiraceae bacterium]